MVKLLILPVLVLLLTACQQQKSNLAEYVAQVKARPPSAITPIPLLQPYEKFEYAGSELADPFLPVVIDFADPIPEQKQIIDNGVRPDTNRSKEALEQYNLANLTLVGTLEQETIWALISTPEGIIHRVQVGNYIGNNYGEIITITDTEVTIKETVAEGNGSYIYRNQIMAIRE